MTERLGARKSQCQMFDRTRTLTGVPLLVLLGVFLQSSCSQNIGNNEERTDFPPIILNEYGLSLGGLLIDSTTTEEQLTQSLGKPTRASIPTETERSETLDSFGTIPNDIFTYDSLGIVLYRDHGFADVKSVVVSFQGDSMKYRARTAYGGLFKLGSSLLSHRTTLAELRNLPILKMNDVGAAYYHRSGEYWDYHLSFEFDGPAELGTLTAIAIALPQPRPSTNAHGWSAESIQMLKAGSRRSKRVLELVNQAEADLDTFVNCYCDSIVESLSAEQMNNPTPAMQQRIASMGQGCLERARRR